MVDAGSAASNEAGTESAGTMEGAMGALMLKATGEAERLLAKRVRAAVRRCPGAGLAVEDAAVAAAQEGARMIIGSVAEAAMTVGDEMRAVATQAAMTRAAMTRAAPERVKLFQEGRNLKVEVDGVIVSTVTWEAAGSGGIIAAWQALAALADALQYGAQSRMGDGS